MADAKTAFLITIDPEHEGGFQIDPKDRGNWTDGEIGKGELKGTKYGISAHWFPALDIFNLTPSEAVNIYIDGYWKPYYSQIEDQGVANKLADLGVLFGVGEAVKVLQSVLKLPVDGLFGPETLQEVNVTDSESLLSAYKAAFVSHALAIGASNPNERADVPDWIRRINS